MCTFLFRPLLFYTRSAWLLSLIEFFFYCIEWLSELYGVGSDGVCFAVITGVGVTIDGVKVVGVGVGATIVETFSTATGVTVVEINISSSLIRKSALSRLLVSVIIFSLNFLFSSFFVVFIVFSPSPPTRCLNSHLPSLL